MIKRAIKEVHADDTKRFLLLHIRFVKHPHVDDNLVWFTARLGLKSHTKPAMRFTVLFETARRNSIGKNEKCLLNPEFCVEPLQQKIVFVVEHRPQTGTADVTVGRSINRVTEGHVVGRHRFGDGACRTAHTEKSTRYFLARANLGECAVLADVQVDLENLFVGANLHLWIHTIAVAAISDRRKSSNRPWLVYTPARSGYMRTCSAFFAGIQPRRLFGSAA